MADSHKFERAGHRQIQTVPVDVDMSPICPQTRKRNQGTKARIAPSSVTARTAPSPHLRHALRQDHGTHCARTHGSWHALRRAKLRIAGAKDASEEKAKRRSETPHGTHCAEQATRRGGAGRAQATRPLEERLPHIRSATSAAASQKSGSARSGSPRARGRAGANSGLQHGGHDDWKRSVGRRSPTTTSLLGG